MKKIDKRNQSDQILKTARQGTTRIRVVSDSKTVSPKIRRAFELYRHFAGEVKSIKR